MIRWWRRFREFYRTKRGKRRLTIVNTIVSAIVLCAIVGPDPIILPIFLTLVLASGAFSYWMID